MKSPRLGLSLLICSVAACGGGDDGVVPDATISDGPAAPDSETPPDAAPAPDAMITADLGCAADTLPINGTDPIVINGHASSASTSGQADLLGATAEAYATGNATALATDTSDALGLYTLTVANAGLAPLDGYVKGTAATFLDSYLYPPFPLAADTDNAPLLFITQGTLGLLGFASGATQDASLGFLGVLVLDCAGAPIENATVSISPTSTTPATKIVYVGTNNIPDTSLTHTSAAGLAFVFNAPTGNVVVDASVGGMSLREHTINVRIGTDGVGNDVAAVTTTAVAPGPITP